MLCRYGPRLKRVQTSRVPHETASPYANQRAGYLPEQLSVGPVESGVPTYILLVTVCDKALEEGLTLLTCISVYS